MTKRGETAISRTRADMPDVSTMLQNIRKVAQRCTADEWAEGATWYRIAHDHARTMADGNVWQGAGMIAALSPRQDWDRNVQLAYQAFADGSSASLGCLTLAKRKAQALLEGEPVMSTVGKGRKTRCFTWNIAEPDRPGPVTVDRHAIAIAYGRPLSDAEVKVLERKGAYQLIAGCYRTIAREYNVLPHVLQAATWVTWRNLK